MNINKTKVAIYARSNQTYGGVEKQLQAIRSYCKENGKEIYAEYVDRDVSGTSMEGRHSLQRLLEDAENEKFSELIVWKIDRLARNTLDVITIIDKLDEHGIIFQSVVENLNYSTPTGRFALHMMASLIEYELNFEREKDKHYDNETH